MKRNQIFHVTAMIGLVLAQTLCFAGVRSSGGGLAVVCRDANQNIIKAQLLDLYEAEQLQVKLQPASGSLENDYLSWDAKYRRVAGFTEITEKEKQATLISLRSMINNFVFTLPGHWLNRLFDEGNIFSPPQDCQYEQLAIYHDDHERIEVDKQIWMKMDSLNQAALLVHEAVWKRFRTRNEEPMIRKDFKVKTSLRTRNLVGAFFSQLDVPPEYGDILTNATICTAQVGIPSVRRFDVYFYSGRGSGGEQTSFIKLKKLDGINLSTPLVFELKTLIPPTDFYNFGGASNPENAVSLVYPTQSLEMTLPLPAHLGHFLKLTVNHSTFRFDFLNQAQMVTQSAFFAGCSDDFLGTEL